MQTLKYQIISMTEMEAKYLTVRFAQMGQHEPLLQFLKYIEEEMAGLRTNLVLQQDSRPLGYVTILWNSDYPYFAEQKIPEIKDLNILPEYRNQGVGTALLKAAESIIIKRSKFAGLGVEFSAHSTRKLYSRLGYCPNDDEPTLYVTTLRYDGIVRPDPIQVLWLIKKLGENINA